MTVSFCSHRPDSFKKLGTEPRGISGINFDAKKVPLTCWKLNIRFNMTTDSSCWLARRFSQTFCDFMFGEVVDLYRKAPVGTLSVSSLRFQHRRSTYHVLSPIELQVGNQLAMNIKWQHVGFIWIAMSVRWFYRNASSHKTRAERRWKKTSTVPLATWRYLWRSL